MGVPLPNLDDRTYADLVAEARALIPTVAPEWTDHNPTDPGITLVELFAWLVEGLAYRADQITPDARLTFVRLLVGPHADLTPPAGLDDRALRAFVDDQVRAALREVRSLYRAVTAEDYEQLTLEASPDVVRAHCVPRRQLEFSVDVDRPASVSVIVLPRADADASAVRADVAAYLEPRRILTTQVDVVPPSFAPVRVEAFVARRADVTDEAVAASVSAALTAFLDPLTGGADGSGWPFARAVYTSELVALLEALPEIDYVPSLALASTVAPHEPAHRPGVPEWNDAGEVVAVTLAPDQLAALRPFGDPAHPPDALRSRLFVSARYVTVWVTVAAAAVGGATPAAIGRAVDAAVRRYFHPDFGGPTGRERWAPGDALGALRTAIDAAASSLATISNVYVRTDPPERIYRDARGVDNLAVEEEELVDPELTVTL